MSTPPRVSAIIPARNEEVNIARAVESLAQQPCLSEILVVDDQSSDRTPEILCELAARIPRLRTLRIESLPEGWTGKAYAAAQGERSACGEWLLFTDADTQHLPGSLAELLTRAEAEQVDLLSLSPAQLTPTWWERAVIPLVYVKLASLFRFEEVSDPASPAAAANGQFVLIRRDAYERSGGHEAVKSEILEDVELARRVKAQGGKLLFLPGARWVRTRMYHQLREMWQGWSKNLYLLYQRDTYRMLAAIGSLWLLEVAPVLAFVAAGAWVALGRGGAVAALAAVALFVLALAREWSYARALTRLGFDPSLASYLPLGAVLLGALLLNSLRIHRRGGNIEWKGRRYAARLKG